MGDMSFQGQWREQEFSEGNTLQLTSVRFEIHRDKNVGKWKDSVFNLKFIFPRQCV